MATHSRLRDSISAPNQLNFRRLELRRSRFRICRSKLDPGRSPLHFGRCGSSRRVQPTCAIRAIISTTACCWSRPLPRYALDALRLGIADAALVDATTLRLYQREYPNWRVERIYLTRDYYAVAVAVGRHDAWRLIDSALAALIDGGQVATIIDSWL